MQYVELVSVSTVVHVVACPYRLLSRQAVVKGRDNLIHGIPKIKDAPLLENHENLVSRHFVRLKNLLHTVKGLDKVIFAL